MIDENVVQWFLYNSQSCSIYNNTEKIKEHAEYFIKAGAKDDTMKHDDVKPLIITNDNCGGIV